MLKGVLLVLGLTKTIVNQLKQDIGMKKELHSLKLKLMQIAIGITPIMEKMVSKLVLKYVKIEPIVKLSHMEMVLAAACV